MYPKTNHEDWAKMYGLYIKSRACQKCKKVFETTVPVAIKGYRGLQAPLHECGIKYIHSIFVPVEKEEIKFWMDLKYGI